MDRTNCYYGTEKGIDLRGVPKNNATKNLFEAAQKNKSPDVLSVDDCFYWSQHQTLTIEDKKGLNYPPCTKKEGMKGDCFYFRDWDELAEGISISRAFYYQKIEQVQNRANQFFEDAKKLLTSMKIKVQWVELPYGKPYYCPPRDYAPK